MAPFPLPFHSHCFDCQCSALFSLSFTSSTTTITATITPNHDRQSRPSLRPRPYDRPTTPTPSRTTRSVCLASSPSIRPSSHEHTTTTRTDLKKESRHHQIRPWTPHLLCSSLEPLLACRSLPTVVPLPLPSFAAWIFDDLFSCRPDPMSRSEPAHRIVISDGDMY